jgi:hypothetical protein
MSGPSVEEVRFDSCGVACAADLYQPDPGSFPGLRPAVVMGHGFSVIKSALVPHAQYLVDAGYVVMAIDYRGFGESGGEPRAQIAPLDQVEDYRNALSWLEQREDLVRPGEIGAWGVSFGGGVVLYAAAVEERFSCVVAQSPAFGRRWTTSLRNPFEWEEMRGLLAQERRRLARGEAPRRIPLTCLPSEGPSAMPGDELAVGFIRAAEEQLPGYRSDVTLQSVEKVAEFFPDRIIDLISPRPMMIVTNLAYDVHHPFAQAQEAFARAGEPKQLVPMPYDTVGLYSEPGLGEAMRHSIAWFDAHLGVREAAPVA